MYTCYRYVHVYVHAYMLCICIHVMYMYMYAWCTQHVHVYVLKVCPNLKGPVGLFAPPPQNQHFSRFSYSVAPFPGALFRIPPFQTRFFFQFNYKRNVHVQYTLLKHDTLTEEVNINGFIWQKYFKEKYNTQQYFILPYITVQNNRIQKQPYKY